MKPTGQTRVAMEQKPAFLDLLDSEPLRAAECFYRFALRYFEMIGPKYLTYFEPDERLDIKHEICLHCLKDNFRVLRLYHHTASDFYAWFHVIAHNKAMDIIKSQKRRPQFSNPTVESTAILENVVSPSPDPQRVLEIRDKLRLVNKVIIGMNRYCQLLLRLSGEEFTPIEITRVLRWPSQKSKKVATDVSYCRKALRQRLSSEIGLPKYESR